MTYFDDFKTRLNASGASESDAFKQATSEFINDNFENSSNWKLVPVDGVSTSCRIVNTDSFRTRDMILKQGTRLNIGSLVTLDSNYFLITDFVYDNIISKARLTICSDIIKWHDKNGVLKQYHIVGNTVSRFNITEETGTLTINELGLFSVQRNADTDLIVPSQRFIIGGKAVSITGVNNFTTNDSIGNGISVMAITMSTISPLDDFTNGIADNSFLHDKDKKNNTDGGAGGNLW